MNLPFSQKFPNGNRTYFIDKIMSSLLKTGKIDKATWTKVRLEYLDEFKTTWSRQDYKKGSTPKNHSIRRLDKNGKKRWRTGMLIDFWVNMRTKKQFRFAPKLPVVCVQDIKIVWEKTKYRGSGISVFVDDKLFSKVDYDELFGASVSFPVSPKSKLQYDKLHDLAVNDGFETLTAFFDWFSEDFKGQLIHWTDLKY